jgi:hypothetical protein
VAPNTGTPTDTDEAEYLAVVAECKAATADKSRQQWVVGDGAAKVEKRYGKNRLAKFAEDINFDGELSTLKRSRDICRAFPKERVRPRYFASAQILATHPDRFTIRLPLAF